MKNPEKGQTQRQNERRAAEFFRIVEKKLRPVLDEFGLRRTSVEDGGSYSYYSVVFQNDQAALRVYFEWREPYLSVQVCRLVGGKVQRNPESLDAEWTCFHVEDLLTLSAPEYQQSTLWLGDEWPGEEGMIKEIGSRLENYSEALRSYGGNILRGDFTIFPQLEKIAKQRAKERGAL